MSRLAATEISEIIIVTEVESSELDKIVDLIYKSKKPIIYSGGGVVNSGDKASALLQDLVRMTGFPITSTLQGLGAFPGDDQQFLGMLGMHGTFEANNAMHDCDLIFFYLIHIHWCCTIDIHKVNELTCKCVFLIFKPFTNKSSAVKDCV